MKTYNERAKLLQAMGIDTTKYDIETIILKPKDLEAASAIVEDKQVNNSKLFRRWITAQTFRMLYETTYNYNTGYFECGWDAYLRNRYGYKYQFTMLLEELKTLNKLQYKDKNEFEERKVFFNKHVVVKTCEHYIRNLKKYIIKNKNANNEIKLAKYGTVDVHKVGDIFINSLEKNILSMIKSDSYAELYTHLKTFMEIMNKIPENTPKCQEWKDAFKGSGAYFTLKNLIMFHDVTLEGLNKQESLSKLEKLLDEYDGAYWKFHILLKDTIEFNNFDLRKSIEAHK